MPSASRYIEVERAIRSVPGVAEASIVEAADSGRGRLRIRLHPGEDAERVSWSVAATLRERFGIALDPEQIRPRPAEEVGGQQHEEHAQGANGSGNGSGDHDRPRDDVVHGSGVFLGSAAGGRSDDVDELVIEETADPPPPPPTLEGELLGEAGPAGGTDVLAPASRPAIRDLRSHTYTSGVVVTATLDLAGRLAEGRSMGVPTSRGLLRTIAEATVMALGELTGQRLRAQIDRVSLGGSDPTTVTVVITLLSDRGEELLLGASIVRDDIEHAVMRATLDGLNRRVQGELPI